MTLDKIENFGDFKILCQPNSENMAKSAAALHVSNNHCLKLFIFSPKEKMRLSLLFLKMLMVKNSLSYGFLLTLGLKRRYGHKEGCISK